MVPCYESILRRQRPEEHSTVMVLEVPEIWNSSEGPSPLEDLSYTSWNSVRENRYMVQRAYISLAKVLNTLAFFLLTIAQQFTTDFGLLRGTSAPRLAEDSL